MKMVEELVRKLEGIIDSQITKEVGDYKTWSPIKLGNGDIVFVVTTATGGQVVKDFEEAMTLKITINEMAA